MAAGLSFAVKAATLLPRAGFQTGTAVLSSPTIWAALTKGAADGAAYGDQGFTAQGQLKVAVDVNEARLASTAAVAGGIYLATQLFFYNKLQMELRLQAAGSLLAQIRTTTAAVELAIDTAQLQLADDGLKEVAKLGKLLEAVNTAQPADLGSLIDEVARGTIRVSADVEELINLTPFFVSNPDLIAVANPLFEIDDLLGIRAVAKEVQAGGAVAQTVKAAIARKAILNNLKPKISSLLKASQAGAKAAGTATALTRFTQGVKIGASKVLLVDTVIWGITLGIDLGLNLFLTEEEQENLPLIGFLFADAGWSPIGEALEWVIVNTVELFVGEETAQSLYELFVIALISASQAPLISDMFEIILSFYVDEINGELLTPLEFESFDFKLSSNILALIKGDPLIILELAFYLITAKAVLLNLILPVLSYSLKSVRGEAASI
jgi:hypothetical protein